MIQMAKVDQSVKAKIAFLKLAQELGNVSKACEIYGYSRDSYYRFKKQYEAGGEAALIEHTRSKPILKNRVSEEVKQQAIDIALEHPELGQRKVSRMLTERGFSVSTNGVRSVWLRYDLETKEKRIHAICAKADQGEQILSDRQMEAVRLLTSQLTDASGLLETRYPGYLLVQDSLPFHPMQHLEEIYLHVVIDSYSHFTFASLSYGYGAEASQEFLANEVTGWFKDKGLNIERLLTDRGSEFYQPGASNIYQQYLAKKNIDHILIKAYNSSRINGLCRQFYEHMVKDFFLKQSRTTYFRSLDDIQPLFKEWLHNYNHQCSNPARYCYGKTPAEILQETRHLATRN